VEVRDALSAVSRLPCRELPRRLEDRKLAVGRFLPGDNEGIKRSAIRGKADRLVGLKENVIVGHLIPAGPVSAGSTT